MNYTTKRSSGTQQDFHVDSLKKLYIMVIIVVENYSVTISVEHSDCWSKCLTVPAIHPLGERLLKVTLDDKSAPRPMKAVGPALT